MHLIAREYDRLFLAAILVGSLAGLAAALIGDFAFDLMGCTLCIYQHLPYLVTASLAAIALMVRLNSARYRFVVFICAATFTSDCALAAFHEGLQQGWWAEPSLCGVPSAAAMAASNMQATLADRLARSPCDEAGLTIFGLSPAMLNFTYSAVLTFACIIAAAMADVGKGPSVDPRPPMRT